MLTTDAIVAWLASNLAPTLFRLYLANTKWWLNVTCLDTMTSQCFLSLLFYRKMVKKYGNFTSVCIHFSTQISQHLFSDCHSDDKFHTSHMWRHHHCIIDFFHVWTELFADDAILARFASNFEPTLLTQYLANTKWWLNVTC